MNAGDKWWVGAALDPPYVTMAKKKPHRSETHARAALRRQAESHVRAHLAHADTIAAETDARAALHELQVHQVELELQNEELWRANFDAAAASDKYAELFDFAPVGYFLWDRTGKVLEVNLTGASLVGQVRSALSRRTFAQFVHPDYRQPFADFLNRAFSSADKQTCEAAVFHGDRVVYVLIEGIVVRSGDGDPLYCRAAVIDVTQQKRADQLEAVNRALTEQIEFRRQAELALEHAKRAAEAASESKTRFLAHISHELRTPMNSILGMLDLALPKQEDPTSRDFLQTARESGGLLLGLLNDLLDSAKIESGKMELESAPFSLRHLLRQLRQVFSVQATEKGLDFTSQVAPDLPDGVIGDQPRLRQILVNLIANAIKFTDRGRITVGARVQTQTADEATLEFTILDTGIGLRRSEIKKLFVPFAQADSSTGRRFGGTGLGLSICASLAKLMNGQIDVESEPGKGSTFRFTVRLSLAKESIPEAKPKPLALEAAERPLRLLLVEDNPANQKLAFYILNKRGHEVEIAGNGTEGVQHAAKHHYDAILMDVQMPGMNGLEAAAEIRLRENGAHRVPIIAMTAHAMRSDRDRCLAAGMDAYLSKPINAQEMIDLIETLAK
jgi:PAS domain S-box-containing protein